MVDFSIKNHQKKQCLHNSSGSEGDVHVNRIEWMKIMLKKSEWKGFNHLLKASWNSLEIIFTSGPQCQWEDFRGLFLGSVYFWAIRFKLDLRWFSCLTGISLFINEISRKKNIEIKVFLNIFRTKTMNNSFNYSGKSV